MARRFEVYAPLQDFWWDGDDFPFAGGVAVKRIDEIPDLGGRQSFLSSSEWQRATQCSHWLTFHWAEGTEPEPADATNLFLLSLWLAKPTKCNVAVRFEINRSDPGNGDTVSRVLDRFSWIPGTLDPDFRKDHLQQASLYYQTLEPIYGARGRLSNAVVLTVTGCWSSGWQTALICQAAAAETILTYSTTRGLTQRLGISYACLVASDKAGRDAAYKDFVDLYSARSDVVHGRMHRMAHADALPTLFRFQTLLRKLWHAVLISPQLTAALELDDASRKAHLAPIQAGYTPPP
jgi:hypothetical protein